MLRSVFVSVIFLINNIHCIDESSPLYQEIEHYHNETNAKAEYAYQVVDKIFNAFQQWFFTITFCDFTYFENRILKYTETYDYGYPVMLLNGCPDTNNSKSKPKIDRHGQTAYLVTSDDLTIEGSEQALMALASTGVFKPRSAVIFIINSPVTEDSYFYYSMKNHFQLLWSASITNSVLILWSGSLKMFTYNPFCNEVRDITHVQNVTKYLSRQYYNLYGYPLRLSVFSKPYVSDDPEPVGCNSRLVMTVMNQLNASCRPLKPRDDSTVGDLLENGTATGVTRDLMDGYTDMELSSRILKTTYYGYIDTTYPLIQDELCFLIKKSIKQSTFTTTLKLISKDMLILLIFNVIFLIVVSVIVIKVESKIWKESRPEAEETILDVVRCLIRQTVDIKFVGPVFRWVSLMIMIYSLIVDCAIDGIITSAISYPRFKPDINTLSELLKTNLTFCVHNRDFQLFNKSLIPEYYEKFKDRIEIVNDDKIKQILDKRNYGYAILLRKSDADYIAQKPSNMVRGRPIYHTVLDCPVPCSIVYGLKYGSPYLPRLNYLLHHLNQGGILQYWSLTEKFTSRLTTTKLTKDKKALTTENLKEFFIVWIIGLILGTIIFFTEFLVYASRKNNQNPLEFLMDKRNKAAKKTTSIIIKNKVYIQELCNIVIEKLKSLLHRKKKEPKEKETKVYEYCD